MLDFKIKGNKLILKYNLREYIIFYHFFNVIFKFFLIAFLIYFEIKIQIFNENQFLKNIIIFSLNLDNNIDCPLSIKKNYKAIVNKQYSSRRQFPPPPPRAGGGGRLFSFFPMVIPYLGNLGILFFIIHLEYVWRK